MFRDSLDKQYGSRFEGYVVRIIEVVGLAGVGKSTLTNELIDNYPGSYGRYRLNKLRYAFTIIMTFIYISPLLIFLLFKKKVRNPLKPLLHFEASINNLEKIKNSKHGTLILDQGPIFGFVSMSMYELDYSGFKYIKNRYHNNIKRFGQLLDGVIYLSAPIDELVVRVDKRDSKHQLKTLEIKDKHRFYERYEARYITLLSEVKDKYNVPVCTIDSSKHGINEVKCLSTEFIRSL